MRGERDGGTPGSSSGLAGVREVTGREAPAMRGGRWWELRGVPREFGWCGKKSRIGGSEETGAGVEAARSQGGGV